MKLFAPFAGILFALPVRAQDVLPSQYTGIWATEESVFRGASLIGGAAIYLDTDGRGAIVGAPLPVGKCGDVICTPIIGAPIQAALGQDENTIRVAITDGRTTIERTLIYKSESKTLVMQEGSEKGQVFLRRNSELPSDVRAALHGKHPSPSGVSR